MRNIRTPIYLAAFCLAIGLGSCKSSSTNPPSNPGGSGGTNIGPDGGTVTSADGKVTVVIPAGALSSNQNIAITELSDSNTCPQGMGTLYSLTPNGLQFSKPAMLTLPYDSTMPGANAELLGVAYQDDNGNWYGLTGGSVDTVHRTCTVPIPHFSVYGGYRSIEITPSSTIVFTGTALAFEVSGVGALVSAAASSPVPLVSPLALLSPAWKVNGITGGNATVGTFSDFQSNPGLYNAPQQMPSPVTVTLSATVTTSSGQSVAPIAFVHVLARNWKLASVDTLIFSCPSMITYTDVSGGYLDFQLNDDGSVTSYPWFPGDNGTMQQAVCPQFQGLVASYTISRGQDMAINSVKSWTFTPGSNTVVLRTDARWRDLPGYDATMKVGDPVHVPISPGNEYQGGLIYNNISANQSFLDDHSSGAYYEHIRTTLTAQ